MSLDRHPHVAGDGSGFTLLWKDKSAAAFSCRCTVPVGALEQRGVLGDGDSLCLVVPVLPFFKENDPKSCLRAARAERLSHRWDVRETATGESHHWDRLT